MAVNAVIPIYKTALLKACASVDLVTDTTTNGVWVDLIDTGVYTFSTAHDFYNDVTAVAGARIGTAQRVTSPTVGTVAAGVFDGANLTYTAVTTATSIEGLMMHRKNAGATSTQRLVLWEATGVTGLPVTPNGGNISITWATSGIFRI